MREIASAEKGFNAYLFFYMILLALTFVMSFTGKITNTQWMLININLCAVLTITALGMKLLTYLMRKGNKEAAGMMFAFYDYYQEITPLNARITFREFMIKLNGDKEWRDKFFRDFYKHYKFKETEIEFNEKV